MPLFTGIGGTAESQGGLFQGGVALGAHSLNPSSAAISQAVAATSAASHLNPTSAGTSAATAALTVHLSLTPVSAASSGAACTISVIPVGWVNYNTGAWSWSNSLDVSYWINPPSAVTAAWTTGASALWETAGVIITFGIPLVPRSAAMSNAFVTVTAPAVGAPVSIILTGVGGTIGSVGTAMLGSVIPAIQITPSAVSSSRAICTITTPAAVAIAPTASSASSASALVTRPAVVAITPTSSATSAAAALVTRPGIVVLTLSGSVSTSGATCSVVYPGEVITPIPTPISPVFVSTTRGPAVKWDWYLATPTFSGNVFQGFSNIGLLDTAQNRSIALSMNGVESAAFSVNILDSIAEQIWLHTLINCLVLYRNDEIKWSGPLWTARPTVNATTQTLQVTAVGWFQYLLKRLLKCGVEGVNPMVGPTSTSSGVSQSYVAMDPTAIAVDLVTRTNFEYPLPISIGFVEPNPNGVLWNVSYQQLQNIGQAIQTLSNAEGGFDFRVDPATLQLDFYYGLVKAGSTVYGRGQDRPNAVFNYPGNLTELAPTEDASNVATQMTVLDQLTNSSQYPGAGEITESITTYGMMQDTASLSDINSLTITTAYAGAEVAFRSAPEVIWTFTPFAYHGDADVPQPFVDYDIGDFVYLTANYGCLQVPLSTAMAAGPMPIRMFSFTITLDNEGNEMISNVQSVFTSTS